LAIAPSTQRARLAAWWELRTYAEQNPDALIVPTHDIDVWQRLRDAY